MKGDNTQQIVVMCVSLGGVMIATSPVIAPVIVIALVLFCLVTIAVDRSNIEVRRITNNTVSPLLTSLNEMRAGAAVIRGMRLSPFFTSRLSGFADEWGNMNFLFKS